MHMFGVWTACADLFNRLTKRRLKSDARGVLVGPARISIRWLRGVETALRKKPNGYRRDRVVGVKTTVLQCNMLFGRLPVNVYTAI